LAGDFLKGEISLDLLYPETGEIHRRSYPVNYDRFKYRFLDNKMSAEELSPLAKPSQKEPFIKYNGLHINYERDFISRYNRLSADFGLNIRKIRIQGFTEVNLNQQNPLIGGIRVGYKLF